MNRSIVSATDPGVGERFGQGDFAKMGNDEPIALDLETRQIRQAGIDLDFFHQRAERRSVVNDKCVLLVALRLFVNSWKFCRLRQKIVTQRNFHLEPAETQIVEMAAQRNDVDFPGICHRPRTA